MGERGKSTSSCLKYLWSQIGCWVGGSKLIETCLLNMQFYNSFRHPLVILSEHKILPLVWI